MEKLKLERITHYEKDKDGKQLINRNGKPYSRCVIQTADKKYSGFGSQITRGWKEGEIVEVEVTQNGQYLNFSIPKPKVVDPFEFQALVVRVENLERKVFPVDQEIDDMFEETEAI